MCSTRPRGTDEEARGTDEEARGTDEDDDDEDSDGDALVVILCVIGAFFGGAVFVGATVNKCAAKSAKVAEQPALATIVRMGTVEAVHAADASATDQAQATLAPLATVISVQGP